MKQTQFTNPQEELFWVLKNSRLTLKELGQMLGVSRFAIHAWVNGITTMNAAHEETLQEIVTTMKNIQKTTPKTCNPSEMREQLFTRNKETGLSVVAYFKRKHFQPAGETWGNPLRPEELLR